MSSAGLSFAICRESSISFPDLTDLTQGLTYASIPTALVEQSPKITSSRWPCGAIGFLLFCTVVLYLRQGKLVPDSAGAAPRGSTHRARGPRVHLMLALFSLPLSTRVRFPFIFSSLPYSHFSFPLCPQIRRPVFQCQT